LSLSHLTLQEWMFRLSFYDVLFLPDK